MGVYDSRNHCGAVQIDDLGRRTGKHLCLAIGSDEENASAPNRECGSRGARVVDGVDPSIGENEIGGPLRSEHGGCERDNRKVG